MPTETDDIESIFNEADSLIDAGDPRVTDFWAKLITFRQTTMMPQWH